MDLHFNSEPTNHPPTSPDQPAGHAEHPTASTQHTNDHAAAEQRAYAAPLHGAGEATANAPVADVFTGYHDEMQQIEREGYELGVKKARSALYWVAGIIFASELILAAVRDQFSIYVVIGAGIEGGIFAGLAALSHKKPYTAILTGIILFILLWGVAAVLEPTNIFSGIIVKIVVLVWLFRALPDAKALQYMEKG